MADTRITKTGIVRTSRLAVAVLLFATFLATAVPAPKAEALSGSEFKAGNIIGDSIFFNSSSMTAAQIQNFLNAKVPTCRSGYTCLKDYRQDTQSRPAENMLCNAYGGGNKSAAEIIYDVGISCGINPQTLLVLLQKEQSLVTDTWPEAVQYRSATGYGCPDTAPCDAEYYGFFNQVYHAARGFKRYARDADQYNYRSGRNNNILYNPNGACGSSNVYIENQATAGLYIYTPYQPNAAALNNLYGEGDACSAYGNRNFWRMFNDWFGNTQGSFLVRTPSNPTFYLLTAGTRYAIPSGDILYAYGIERQRVDVVSDLYLNSLTNGGMLSTLFTVPGDNTVFLADGGNKFGISSGEYCVRWGLPCGNSSIQKVVGNEIFDRMGQGGVLQAVMRHNNSYYLMEAGKKRHFLSVNALTQRGYTPSGTTPIVNWTNAIREFDYSLPENNTFVKFGASSAIYLYSGNNFFAIPDYETFTNWFGPNGVSHLDPNSKYNSVPPTTVATLKTLVTGSGATSLIGYTQRFALTGTTPTQTPLNLDTYPNLKTVLTSKQSVTIDASKAVALPSGAIYTLVNNTLRALPTMVDLRLSFSDANVVKVPSTMTDAYPLGKLFMIPGRIFKPVDSGAMYMYGSDGYLWALGNMGELNAALTWTPNAITAPFSALEQSGIKIYTASVRINGNYYAVQNDGSLRQIPQGVLSAGKDGYFAPLTGPISTKPQIDNRQLGFIRFDNGTIFKIESGQIRPIGNMGVYSSLGGSPANTTQVSVKANDAFNIGAPIY